METFTNPASKNHPKKIPTCLPLKVDLTAMVDLGFLLITFFMLATTLNNNMILTINQPDESGPSSPYHQSKILTILLSQNNKAYCYSGEDDLSDISSLKIDSVDFGPNGLRKVIIKRQNEVEQKYGRSNRDQLFVLIKPLPNASLKNTVDVLDEMRICDVKRYAILDAKAALDKLVVDKIDNKNY